MLQLQKKNKRKQNKREEEKKNNYVDKLLKSINVNNKRLYKKYAAIAASQRVVANDTNALSDDVLIAPNAQSNVSISATVAMVNNNHQQLHAVSQQAAVA